MPIDSTSPTALPTLDEDARGRFESAWLKGKPESIESFLPPSSHPHYLPTLEELVHIELEFAWKAFGKQSTRNRTDTQPPPKVEQYLTRFPALDQPAIVLRLIRQEFQVRQLHADRPEITEYQQRFPHLVTTGAEVAPTKPGLGIDPRSPVELQGFEVLGEVGRGGMGVVYEVRQPGLERIVALKMIKGLSSTSGERERFIAEARIAAHLDHPGVVPVHELTNPVGGAPYYTMKLVRGQTLEEAIRRYHKGTLPLSERTLARQRLLTVFLAVTRTMEFAHARGVIHRDLKPANIVLGDYGETVILDWGLAKLLRQTGEAEHFAEQALPTSPDATVPGTVLGTPTYMSPEQAEGNLDAIDECSDIYSLGAILYQVLTGVPPFTGHTHQVLQQLLQDPPVRPRLRNNEVALPLEAICLKALEKQRENRYPTVSSLARDVESYLAGEPVTAYREGPLGRLARWSRGHRTLVTTAVVAAMLLIAGGVGALFLIQRGARDRERAEHERIQQRSEFEQTRLRQAFEHRLSLENAARSDDALALAEMHAGRFARAERILHKAIVPLQAESELAKLRQELEDRRARAHKLAEFYRLWDRTERLAAVTNENNFIKTDEETLATCQAALKQLRIYETGDHWWDQLPDQDLRAEQTIYLRDNIARALGMSAIWWGKRGLYFSSPVAFLLKRNQGEDANSSYRAALVDLRLVQEYNRERYQRPSSAVEVLEMFCHYQLGHKAKLKPVKLESRDAPEAYYLGVTHLFLSSQFTGILAGEVIKRFPPDLRHLSGLDFATPLLTATQLLRTAAALEPSHYWTHFWLARCFEVNGNYIAAEQSFNTCVALRPDLPLGYSGRSLTLLSHSAQLEYYKSFFLPQRLAQQSVLSLPFDPCGLNPIRILGNMPIRFNLAQNLKHWLTNTHLQKELRSRASRELELAPADLHHQPAIWAARAICLRVEGRHEESLAAASRAVEIEAAQHLVFGSGSRSESVAPDVLRSLADLPASERTRVETKVVRALAFLAAERNDDAGKEAGLVLSTHSADPSANAVMATLSLLSGRVDEAWMRLQALNTKHSENLLIAMGYAVACERKAEWLKALAAYDAVLTRASERMGTVSDWRHLAAHLGRATSLAKLGRDDEARAALEAARLIDTALADARAAILFPEEKP